MNITDIIRAWKDREYRKSLSEEERAKRLENSVGQIESTEDELNTAAESARRLSPPNDW